MTHMPTVSIVWRSGNVGFHFPVKLLLHLAGNLGGKEPILNGAVCCAQPGNRAADGQRQQEHDCGHHCRQTAIVAAASSACGSRLRAVLRAFKSASVHL